MSRIGKNPIAIPDGVKIELKGNLINVSGKKGSQSWTVHPNIKTLHLGHYEHGDSNCDQNTGDEGAIEGIFRHK